MKREQKGTPPLPPQNQRLTVLDMQAITLARSGRALCGGDNLRLGSTCVWRTWACRTGLDSFFWLGDFWAMSEGW